MAHGERHNGGALHTRRDRDNGQEDSRDRHRGYGRTGHSRPYKAPGTDSETGHDEADGWHTNRRQDAGHSSGHDIGLQVGAGQEDARDIQHGWSLTHPRPLRHASLHHIYGADIVLRQRGRMEEMDDNNHRMGLCRDGRHAGICGQGCHHALAPPYSLSDRTATTPAEYHRRCYADNTHGFSGCSMGHRIPALIPRRRRHCPHRPSHNRQHARGPQEHE